jgi:hypothetical protein
MNTRFTRRAALRAMGASAIPLAAQTGKPKEKGMELGAFSISFCRQT